MKHTSPDPAAIEDDAAEPPSKSQRKRESTALQDLGEALVALSTDRLQQLDLPENLLAAVLEAQRIHKFGAQRRQFQYIGKLMRKLDAAPIRARLEALEGHSRTHTAWLHRLERWRERLLTDEAALGELVTVCPGADTQQLRTLIRNAQREQAQAKPPRSFRELFQRLRELMPEPVPDGPTHDDEGER